MRVVIVDCFETFENRVELLNAYFIKRGDEVTVYTADYCHFQKCKRVSAPKNYCLIPTLPYQKNLSVKRMRSHVKFAKAVRMALEAQAAGIDLLWVILPPNSLAKQMTELKRQNEKLRLVLDICDMWPETMPIPKVKDLFPFTYWRSLRDKYLSGADMVVAECDLFLNKVKPKVAEDKLYRLYYAKKDTVSAVCVGALTEECGLCYLGSINNVIDIEMIGRIIKQLSKEKKVTLHIIGDGERRTELIDTAENAGAAVEYHGIIYENSQKEAIFARCQFGLNIMKESVFVGLTMKSMDYFAGGLPMINNIKGDTWDIVAGYGFGVNYPFTCAEIEKSLEDEQVHQRMRVFYEEHFSEEAFNKGLDEIMEKIYENRN